MITDLEAVLQLILEESSIADLLGFLKDDQTGVNTAFKMAMVGKFPEIQTNLPAISVRRTAKDVQFGVSMSFVSVSCYDDSELGAETLADAVNEFFRDSQGGVNGFAARFESNISATVIDGDQVGVIVELKLDYR